MTFLQMKDIIEQFDHVDDPDVLSKARTNRALEAALEMCRPENWRGSGLTPDQILPVAIEGGIPVAWVPPVDVLKALVAAPNERRLPTLMSREGEVVAQCRERVTESSDAWIIDEATLVGRALDAFEGGYHEAAMALAVAVGEPLAIWASEPRVHVFTSKEEMEAWDDKRRKQKYQLAKLELATISSSAPIERHDVLRSALIGPIPKFFEPFYGREGESIPETVSRHATVHQPTVSHFNRANALLAIMLATSILRDQQAWCVEVRITDYHDDAD